MENRHQSDNPRSIYTLHQESSMLQYEPKNSHHMNPKIHSVKPYLVDSQSVGSHDCAAAKDKSPIKEAGILDQRKMLIRNL